MEEVCRSDPIPGTAGETMSILNDSISTAIKPITMRLSIHLCAIHLNIHLLEVNVSVDDDHRTIVL